MCRTDKIAIAGLVIFAVLLFVMSRSILLYNHMHDVKLGAIRFVYEQKLMDKPAEYNDADTIVDMIFPKSEWAYAINPLIWNKEDMSNNDELLKQCMDAYYRDENKEKLKKAEDKASFEERSKEWETK